MIVICLTGVIAALAVAWLIRPLITGGYKKWAFVTGSLIAFTAIAIYMVLGSPDLPGAPALFEKTGPRAEHRALTGYELTLMQALSEEPKNVSMMLSLASVRIQAGRPADALAVLEVAHKLEQDNESVLLELGAAHFAAALVLLGENNNADAIYHLKKARDTAPPGTEYINEINKLLDQLN